MSLHGGEPEGWRVGKVYTIWLAPGLSSSIFFFFFFLLPPSLLPLPFLPLSASFSLFPEPVAHKLIRSRCPLARDSHWPPQSRRSLCFLSHSLSISLSLSLSPFDLSCSSFRVLDHPLLSLSLLFSIVAEYLGKVTRSIVRGGRKVYRPRKSRGRHTIAHTRVDHGLTFLPRGNESLVRPAVTICCAFEPCRGF